MHFRSGDQPGEITFKIEEDVDLDDFTGATVTIDGLPLGSATIDEGEVKATPSGPITLSGLLPVTVTLTGASGVSITVEGEPVVVEIADGWHSIASLRRRWRDAASAEDEDLFVLLEAAKRACLMWLTSTSDLDVPGVLTEDPEHPGLFFWSSDVMSAPVTILPDWREAQYLQARAIWQAGKASGDDGLGLDSQAIRVFPLDWNVKQLLTPKRRLPSIV